MWPDRVFAGNCSRKKVSGRQPREAGQRFPDTLLGKLNWVASMLKKTELVEFRALLLVLQTRLRGDVQHLADGALRRSDGDGDSKSPTHIAELGTDNYEQDFSLRFVENEQEILEEISLALKKIDAGTYGLCENCLAEGKPPAKSVIIKERLKAIPYVRTCVHCAEQQRTRKWRR